MRVNFQIFIIIETSRNGKVDIVQEFGIELHAFEIKSARVFHKDFLNNLHYLKKILADSLTITRVIYDGDIDIKAQIDGVVNFRR